MVLCDVTEGWTAPLGPFTLRLDDQPYSLAGFQPPEIVLHTSLGTLVTVGGTLEVLNQALYPGQVKYTPAATDFVFEDDGNQVRQPYRVHWLLTDGNGKVATFPDGEADVINVYRR